jgi:uncharacterized lipoprotein YbaY
MKSTTTAGTRRNSSVEGAAIFEEEIALPSAAAVCATGGVC